MVYVKCCIHVKLNIPLDSMTTNWTLKHISVKGQTVVKTCQSGNLKYIKYQDTETVVEGQDGKMAIKKIIATTVSSRERGQNEEKKEGLRVVKCKQRHRETNEATEAQVKEADKLKKVDGDFPTCMRL